MSLLVELDDWIRYVAQAEQARAHTDESGHRLDEWHSAEIVYLRKLLFVLLAGLFALGAGVVGAVLLSEAKEARTELAEFEDRLDEWDRTEKDHLRKLIFALLACFFTLSATIVGAVLLSVMRG
jgi:hypothetical protein